MNIKEATKEQQLAELIQKINSQGQTSYEQISGTLYSSMAMIWNNPDFTPQEIFDALGTQSANLFAVAGKTIELLTLINPTFVPPTPTQAFTINNNGTVTIQ